MRYLQRELASVFDGFSDTVDAVIGALLSVFQSVPPLVLMAIIVLLVLWLTGWRLALFAALGLLLIENIGLWTPFLSTLALVVTAQILIVVVGLPLGILAASSNTAERIMRPILDFMQTMPAFAWCQEWWPPSCSPCHHWCVW